jgi:hypothetical protein
MEEIREVKRRWSAEAKRTAGMARRSLDLEGIPNQRPELGVTIVFRRSGLEQAFSSRGHTHFACIVGHH